MGRNRETAEKIKIVAGFFIIVYLGAALWYPGPALCSCAIFMMIVAWLLQVLGGRGPR